MADGVKMTFTGHMEGTLNGGRGVMFSGTMHGQTPGVKAPTGANVRLAGVLHPGCDGVEGDAASVVYFGEIDVVMAGAASSGDPINCNASTGKFKKAVASLAVDITAANADFTITSAVSGPAGDDWSLVLIDPGGASATLAAEIYDHQIRVTLGRASSAIDTTANALETLLEAIPEFAANLTFAHASGSNGTGLLNAKAKAYLAGGGNAAATLLEASTADGDIRRALVNCPTF
jgi:hypothetical protein